MLEHNRNYYVYAITNRLLRLPIRPNDVTLDYAASLFFDIDGNQVVNPAAGTDGYGAEGNYATTTGDAQKAALVQALLPPESTINQAWADARDASSLTDYPTTWQWYEANLPQLGFVGAIGG